MCVYGGNRQVNKEALSEFVDTMRKNNATEDEVTAVMCIVAGIELPEDLAEKFRENKSSWVESAMEGACLGDPQEQEADRLARENQERLCVDYPSYAMGFYSTDKGKKFPEYTDFARFMINEIGIKSIDKYTWIYDGNHYKNISDEKLFRIIRDRTIFQAQPFHLKNFVQILRADSQVEEQEIENMAYKVNLKNGVLDLKTKRIDAHSKEHFFKYTLPIEYDQSAQCPKFMRYLDQTFQGDQELMQVTAEIFGYCLYGGDPFLHKSFILFGSGRNGKSVWLHVLQKLLGDENCSSVSMAHLDRPFSVVAMDGKLANITGELPTKPVAADLFKTAVGGEKLTAAKKNKDEFGLRIQCRLVFATNQFPIFRDTTPGMWEKLFIIPFNNYLKPEERNPDIFKDLEAELPGILNFSLNGLERVLKRKRIVEPASVKKMIRGYRMDSDSVFGWAEDHIVVTERSDDFVSVNNLFDYFNIDEGQYLKFRMEKKTFSKRFEQYLLERCPNGTAGRVRRKGSRGFFGVLHKKQTMVFIPGQKHDDV